MTQWEYRKIALYELPRRADDIDLLCDAGREGWELVAILANNVAYLKRQIIVPISERREESEDAATGGDSSAGRTSEVKAKYRDLATGETWSGRGRMATWLKRKQDAGKDIDDYLV